MSALIVVLPREAATASTEFEYVLTQDGASVADHGAAHAATLPGAHRAGTEVVALVPVSMLSWHRVELPKGVASNTPRLRAVLEGLLEDQLLDEPEALHFALQPGAAAGASAWVATCDRAWLRAALHALETAGRPAMRVVPEFAPVGPATLYAIGDASRPLLVSAGADGVTTLPLSTQVLTLLPSVTEETGLVAEPAVAAAAEQVLQRRPELQHAAERAVRAAQTTWDLAQFEFSSSGRARALKKIGTAWADLLAAPQWKPARWGAAALVAINVIGLNAWAWRERTAIDAKREAIGKTLTATFPQVKVVVDAPAQMQRELAALRQAAGATSGSDLEAMLGALTNAVPPQRTVSGFDFAGGELRAKGLALGSDEFRVVAESLRSQGYAATRDGDAVAIRPEAVR